MQHCRQLNDTQAQVQAANATITEKETQIENLKAENVEMQNTAMQSITTMMQKQAAADEKLKKQLADSQKQVKELKQKIESMTIEYDNLKALYEKAKQNLDAAATTAETTAEKTM